MKIMWMVMWQDFSAVFTSREKAVAYIKNTCEEAEFGLKWVDDEENWLSFEVTWYNGDKEIFYAQEADVDPASY